MKLHYKTPYPLEQYIVHQEYCQYSDSIVATEPQTTYFSSAVLQAYTTKHDMYTMANMGSTVNHDALPTWLTKCVGSIYISFFAPKQGLKVEAG